MTSLAARRLRELEKENKEPKQMLADGLLRELLPALMTSSSRSQRLAYWALGLRRNPARYCPLRQGR